MASVLRHQWGLTGNDRIHRVSISRCSICTRTQYLFALSAAWASTGSQRPLDVCCVIAAPQWAELGGPALRADLDRTYVSLLARGLRQPTVTTLFIVARKLDV
jgi:hypothetical protein